MSKNHRSLLYCVACLAAVLLAAGTAWADHHEGEKVVVHLSKFGNDLHAVNMALKLGTMLQKGGNQVTLFVDLEGVRLADSRQPLDLTWGHADPVEVLYKGFLEAGGKVLVCPHCAAAAGLEKDALRSGAAIGTPESIAEALTEATKILDY
jgi:predicted peroxiredoxin